MCRLVTGSGGWGRYKRLPVRRDVVDGLVNQGDNGWDQGLLFLNPWQVWLQPPGYALQMQSQNAQPPLLGCDVQKANGSHLDATATRSTDRKILLLQPVNGGDAETAEIDLCDLKPTRSVARVIELSGALQAVNTAEKPDGILPTQTDWKYRTDAGKLSRTFAAHSVTVIRFE
jgi:hypothetical protein